MYQYASSSAAAVELSPALGAFYHVLTEMNLADSMTTFTCSDFARTLQPNSAAGTDHAWAVTISLWEGL